MDRQLLDRALPAVYAALIVLSIIFFSGGLLFIIIVGALLLGLYYGIVRQRLPGGPAGRDRQRSRNRR